jgi:hypothetical protein
MQGILSSQSELQATIYFDYIIACMGLSWCCLMVPQFASVSGSDSLRCFERSPYLIKGFIKLEDT